MLWRYWYRPGTSRNWSRESNCSPGGRDYGPRWAAMRGRLRWGNIRGGITLRRFSPVSRRSACRVGGSNATPGKLPRFVIRRCLVLDAFAVVSILAALTAVVVATKKAPRELLVPLSIYNAFYL